MTKRPLNKHKFEQRNDAQRPRVVAPTHRSGFRERLGVVALGGRSGSIFVSPRDKNANDRGMSLWPSRSEGVSQRLHGVAPVRSLSCTARPMITFITYFELQMHPNVSKNSMWYSNT
ncbi:hypothetical protein F2Q70_00032418 [Brassica cretica]|uniref:Uncharacterized protein n=1 Tax=Brassica cretica TaxID=69181 RepID=A0A8S9FI23_BRACR|nr:hypothetical protein F2Q70_00032418 [Brassica cretica]